MSENRVLTVYEALGQQYPQRLPGLHLDFSWDDKDLASEIKKALEPLQCEALNPKTRAKIKEKIRDIFSNLPEGSYTLKYGAFGEEVEDFFKVDKNE